MKTQALNPPPSRIPVLPRVDPEMVLTEGGGLSSSPQRIQRKRTKGWRMPLNTISVCRPGKWGNPFIISPNARPGSGSGVMYIAMPTAADAVSCFAEMWGFIEKDQPKRFKEMQSELRGKNLACFCKPGDPCHADILLELANREEGAS